MESHEIATKDADAREQSKNAAVSPLFIFFFQSFVAAALLPAVLGSSGGDMVIAVWRLSLLLCAYFYSAVCVLSSVTRKGKALIFVCVTYAASMAFVVDAILSHGVGTAIIYLDSVWMAGALGHALADHTASSSSEKLAPSSEEVRQKLAAELLAKAFLLIVVATCGISLPCIVSPDVAPLLVVAFLPMLLCLFLTVAIVCPLKPWPSRGALAILGVEFDTAEVFLCSFLSPLIIFLVASLLVGEVGAAIVPWICVLSLAVLLGYCISLHASSACNTIDGWLSVRSNPKPEPLDKLGLPEEQADAAGETKSKKLS